MLMVTSNDVNTFYIYVCVCVCGVYFSFLCFRCRSFNIGRYTSVEVLSHLDFLLPGDTGTLGYK